MQNEFCLPSSPASVRILASSFDQGITNNKGRKGAAEGPQKVKERLERFYCHPHLKNYDWTAVKEEAPLAPTVKNFLKPKQKLIHLGGGHDTVIHAASILQNCDHLQKKKILMINVDPHPDVRDPKIYGWTSGSGFFNLSINFPIFKKYLAIGLAKNSTSSNHIDLVDDILWQDQIPFEKRADFVIKYIQKKIQKFDYAFMSIDLDSIENFEGVSAPCALGFTYREIYQVVRKLCKVPQILGFGFYEFSPPLDPSPLSEIRTAKLVYTVLEG